MSTEITQAAGWKDSLPKPWRWITDRWKIIMRFFKYLYLATALVLVVKVVFDGYSYYLARRSIDAELEAKKISSLEYLTVLQRRDRALMRATLETRCTERIEIALFRIFNVLTETKLRDYYLETMKIKDSLVAVLKDNGPKFLDGWKEAIEFVNSATFTVTGFNDRYLNKQSMVAETDQAYKEFSQQIQKELKNYNDLVVSNPDLQRLAEEVQEEAKHHWHLQAVKSLEERLKRLKEDRAAIPERLVGNLDEILARYAVWTDALTGGLGESELLDEMAVEAKRNDQGVLADVNCQQLKQYNPAEYAALQRAATENNGLTSLNRPHDNKINPIVYWYNDRLLTYFKQPPAAQTLFVTLFMGALGGLTVNVLRLSQLGWWRGEKDPPWGEIFVSPIVGALAALAIYLVGSAGLLLTSDFRVAQTGASPLSASFIGLLGFLSGFLYDAAFGRVRRVGGQMFAGDTATDQAWSASEDDRSLAEVLRGSNASLVAGLVLNFGLGSKLASEREFTFLVPSDRAIGQVSLSTWNEINDRKTTTLDKWYKHHYAPKRVTKRDVARPPSPPVQLELADGTIVEVKVENDELKVGSTKTTAADIAWKNGVIHILQDELAP